MPGVPARHISPRGSWHFPGYFRLQSPHYPTWRSHRPGNVNKVHRNVVLPHALHSTTRHHLHAIHRWSRTLRMKTKNLLSSFKIIKTKNPSRCVGKDVKKIK